jgi:hypothetical protein
MRVLTQNLWGWYHPLDGPGIGRARPGADLASFQEAIHHDAYDQVTDLLGPSLDITACARIFDQPVSGVWGSDHFGVVADLAPPPPEPMVPD